MRVLLMILLLLPHAAFAKAPEKVDAESLMPQAEKKEDNDKKAEPLTPEKQALLICETASLMNEKLKGAEYQPGVDAYGNPVTPADIYNSMPFEVPEQVEVPIAIDVMEAMGIATPAGVEGKTKIGTLTVFKGGQLLYNDKDITNTIEGYCREYMKKMETAPK